MIPLEEKKKNSSWFIYLVFISIIFVILISFYNFYFKKDYDFFVETKCFPEQETCFYRDCANNPDICPPNNLSYYNQFSIKAKDFKYCENEDCTQACILGSIDCKKIECTTDDVNNGLCIIPSNFE